MSKLQQHPGPIMDSFARARGVIIQPPESVNWYITPICNYSCKFCFFTNAGFLRSIDEHGGGGEFDQYDRYQIMAMLRVAGTEKITFAGGEPTLFPLLPDLIYNARLLGMAVMVVTNGTGVTDAFLESVSGNISAIKFSVDSPSSETEARLGRGRGRHVETALQAVQRTKDHGINVMLNTVVTGLNWQEDMHELVREIAPLRWKVFQMLPVANMNAEHLGEMHATDEQFRAFTERHKDLDPITEDNDLMESSYVMIDPVGRFMQSRDGKHVYSRPILEVGIVQALSETGWDFDAYLRRGGRYIPPETKPKEILARQ